MMAIHRTIQEGRLDAQIKLILSNKSTAAGIQYAKDQNLPHKVIEKLPEEKRAEFDQRILREIDGAHVDLVVLAGYMKLLSNEFVGRFYGKIINIHPSLLPKFPGLNAQKQALEAGEQTSGCTVHFVDEGCDSGPIIEQKSVPILPGDDEASLSARILEQEHILYSECIQKIAQGRVKLADLH